MVSILSYMTIYKLLMKWGMQEVKRNLCKCIPRRPRLESDHLCVISCFDVYVARSCPVYRCVRTIRGIDRSAFIADLERELVGVGDSLSVDQYNMALLSMLNTNICITRYSIM